MEVEEEVDLEEEEEEGEGWGCVWRMPLERRWGGSLAPFLMAAKSSSDMGPHNTTFSSSLEPDSEGCGAWESDSDE